MGRRPHASTKCNLLMHSWSERKSSNFKFKKRGSRRADDTAPETFIARTLLTHSTATLSHFMIAVCFEECAIPTRLPISAAAKPSCSISHASIDPYSCVAAVYSSTTFLTTKGPAYTTHISVRCPCLLPHLPPSPVWTKTNTAEHDVRHPASRL